MHRPLYNKLFLAALLSGLLLPLQAANARAKVLHEERSLYSRIMVTERDNLICLQFTVRNDQRSQSCMDRRHPRAMVFSYTRMSMSALLFNEHPRSILVIGLGGGTLPMAFRELLPEAVIDVVEIDPAVVTVAEEYFGFESDPDMQVYTQDARVWTKRAGRKERRYDLIVLDAFTGEYIPEHLMTKEYLEETKALLAPGGTLVANTFAVSDLYHHESATYADVFGSFIDFQVSESANRMIVVPGREVSDEALIANAKALKARLRPYDVEISRYARLLATQRRLAPRWDTEARVLTDQYSPANLLRNQ